MDGKVTDARLDLAVVLPTFNERENVGEVVRRLELALDGLRWEAIFVDDDSEDGTANAVEAYGRRDARIRCLRRFGRRGLSSACIEGVMATGADYVAVMDADLQHDESILPTMLREIRSRHLDVVIGTRNSSGGSMGDFAANRVKLSRAGSHLSRLVARCDVSDPMSGFFMVHRPFFLSVVRHMQGTGFKILLDLLASSHRSVRFGEVGYRFGVRQQGVSKLDLNTGVEYLFLVANKLTRGLVPARFALFALVGAAGVVTHLILLTILISYLHAGFVVAQSCATVVAMTENFFLNNFITFRDLRLRGWFLAGGLVSFWLACSFGAWANLTLARSLVASGWPWYFAGFIGIIISSVWNYSMSSLFTWKRRKRPAPVEMQSALNIVKDAKVHL